MSGLGSRPEWTPPSLRDPGHGRTPDVVAQSSGAVAPAPALPTDFAETAYDGKARHLTVVADPRQRTEELSSWAPRYRGVHRATKRVIDVVSSVLVGILVLPVLVAAAIAVAVTDGRPVFFAQWRVGRHGRPIKVRKIRTMHVDADAELRADPQLFDLYVQNDFKLDFEEDPRVTKLGRTLRKLSIDELPQLLNVFLGQMSMVGPRPVVPDELASYGDLVPAYLVMRPGLTGVWQVSGRNDIAYPERAYLDAAYAREWSLTLDLNIAIRTIPCVLSARGVA